MYFIIISIGGALMAIGIIFMLALMIKMK